MFQDLMGPIGIDRLEPLLPIVRPGGRILEFNSGTGYRAHWLSFVVGPSGGVVAIACDREDAAFAARRYRRANVSFELGENFALAGETDGAFDVVVALELVGDEAGRRMLLRELWRLTAPYGALLVGGFSESRPAGPHAQKAGDAKVEEDELLDELHAIVVSDVADFRTRPGPGHTVDVLVLRQRPDPSTDPRRRGGRGGASPPE